MTQSMPTPSEKALRRVLLISALDGWSVIVIAALGSLLALVLGDLSGMFVGLLIMVAGVVELRGRRRLMRRDADGMRLLVRAQLLLLAVILGYCASRLGSFDADTAMASLTPEMEAALKEAGLERAEILPLVTTVFYAVYSIVAVLSILFQGGMVLYYRSRTARVTEALATPPQSPLA